MDENINLQNEIEQLRRLPLSGLRERYLELFGERSRTQNKVLLFRRIAWRMQANIYGDLSERARQRALALADDRDLRLQAPPGFTDNGPSKRNARQTVQHRLPLPGAVLTRQYRGQTIEVQVLPQGFSYGNRRFRSLSGIAEHITGTRWNGYVFFGLQARKGVTRG